MFSNVSFLNEVKDVLHADFYRLKERDEIIEILMQMSVYAGFPAALNGIFTAREVFQALDETNTNAL